MVRTGDISDLTDDDEVLGVELTGFFIHHPLIQARHHCGAQVNMGARRCPHCEHGIPAASWYLWWDEYLDEIMEAFSTNQVTYVPDLFCNPCCSQPPWNCICAEEDVLFFADADEHNLDYLYHPSAWDGDRNCIQCIHFAQRSCPAFLDFVVEFAQKGVLGRTEVETQGRLIIPCDSWRWYLPGTEKTWPDIFDDVN